MQCLAESAGAQRVSVGAAMLISVLSVHLEPTEVSVMGNGFLYPFPLSSGSSSFGLYILRIIMRLEAVRSRTHLIAGPVSFLPAA